MGLSARRLTVCGCCHDVIKADRPRGMWMECERGPHVDPVEVIGVVALLEWLRGPDWAVDETWAFYAEGVAKAIEQEVS